eukprot:840460-Pyramimonas_sp.AAC.1
MMIHGRLLGTTKHCSTTFNLEATELRKTYGLSTFHHLTGDRKPRRGCQQLDTFTDCFKDGRRGHEELLAVAKDSVTNQ